MECKICKTKMTTLYDEKYDNHYGVCPHCEFIGISSEGLISFEEERIEYDRHENNIENEGYVAMFKKFIDASVVPYVKGHKGLDYGSGPEPVLTQVIHRDYDYKMDHYDLHYQPDKAFLNSKYDFVVSTEVVEHIFEPMEVFRQLYEVLEPGGTLAIMTLFHSVDSEAFLKWWYRRDVTHISFFTPRTFEIIGELLGMKVIYTDNYRYITMAK